MDATVATVLSVTALALTPLLLDVLRTLRPSLGLRRLTSNIIQMGLLASMLGLGLLAMSLYLTLYLPFLLWNSEPNAQTFEQTGWMRVWHTAFALWLWVNMSYNYICAVTTDPGTRKNKTFAHIFAQSGGISACNRCGGASISERKDNLFFRHCRACATCVVGLDHHCPFTGNCVGDGNYLFFLLFLVYFSAGMLYAAWVSVRPLYACVSMARELHATGRARGGGPLLAWCHTFGAKTVLFWPVILGLCFGGGVLLFHICLLVRGVTTRNACSWLSGKTQAINGKNTAMSKGRLWELRHGLKIWQMLAPIGLFGLNERPPLSARVAELIDFEE